MTTGKWMARPRFWVMLVMAWCLAGSTGVARADFLVCQSGRDTGLIPGYTGHDQQPLTNRMRQSEPRLSSLGELTEVERAQALLEEAYLLPALLMPAIYWCDPPTGGTGDPGGTGGTGGKDGSVETPEPASVVTALVGAGAAGLIAWRRRRRE